MSISVPANVIRSKCHYCRKRFADTRDHIVPKSRGGANRAWNYVPACRPCNERKGDAWPTCACFVCYFSVALHAEAGILENAEQYEQLVHAHKVASGIRNGARKMPPEEAQKALDHAADIIRQVRYS